MSQTDQVLDVMSLEVQKLFRAAMQVGDYLAQARQHALQRAEASSLEQARSLRAAIETERRAAEPIYGSALREQFWHDVTPEKAAYVYGVARRFAAVDPQAALSARVCEKEARAKWNVDLTDPKDVTEQLNALSEAAEGLAARAPITPALPGEGEGWQERMQAVESDIHRQIETLNPPSTATDGLNSQELAARMRAAALVLASGDYQDRPSELAQLDAYKASLAAAKEQRESREADAAAQRGEEDDDVLRAAAVAEYDDATRALAQEAAAWDSAESRKTWEDKMEAAHHDPAAIRAFITADKGLSKPIKETMAQQPAKRTANRRQRPNTAARNRQNRRTL